MADDPTAGERPWSEPLTEQERRLAQEWADGKWLGDGWLELLRRLLASEAQARAEVDILADAIEELREELVATGRERVTAVNAGDRVRAEMERLRAVLTNLVSAHDGYRQGMGPCICAAHEDARAALRG